MDDRIAKLTIHTRDGDVTYNVPYDELVDTLDELIPGWYPSEFSYNFPDQENCSDMTTIGNTHEWPAPD